MADTTEKRLSDVDIRFVAVNVKIAEIREVQAVHTARFSKIEARLTAIEAKLNALTSGMIDDRRQARCGPCAAAATAGTLNRHDCHSESPPERKPA